MGRPRRFRPPFEVEITALDKGGTGIGLDDEQVVRVRFAPPGGRIHVVPQGRRKGILNARRTALVRPPRAYRQPPCPVFTLCGGCALQELSLQAQREHKARWVRTLVGETALEGTRVHAPTGAPDGYAYRNRVELSFGPKRYISEQDHADGLPLDGVWLGFHAPGRFDRVVDVERCALVSETMNAVLTIARDEALRPGAPPPYFQLGHEGFWRHLALRQGMETGEVLAVVYTASAQGDEAPAVEALAERLMGADLPGGHVVGVLWTENDDLADVARGTVRQTWGRDWLEEQLGPVRLRLSATSFFQTSTVGARVLYDCIGEALGEPGGTLLDLYCGTGSIGLYLAERFDRIVGVEERPEAIEDARDNALRNDIANTEWIAQRVEEVLDLLGPTDERRSIVVDPPRPGLHPSVARSLARAPADVLVYVACNPASLGRDAAILAEGGWRMTDLWTVDLFPQTGHVEAVGRFVRDGAEATSPSPSAP